MHAPCGIGFVNILADRTDVVHRYVSWVDMIDHVSPVLAFLSTNFAKPSTHDFLKVRAVIDSISICKRRKILKTSRTIMKNPKERESFSKPDDKKEMIPSFSDWNRQLGYMNRSLSVHLYKKRLGIFQGRYIPVPDILERQMEFMGS